MGRFAYCTGDGLELVNLGVLLSIMENQMDAVLSPAFVSKTIEGQIRVLQGVANILAHASSYNGGRKNE